MTREEHKNLLEKARDETQEALSVLAKPNDGVHKALNFLRITGFNYCVSTTSPKPRVPVCVECARLQDFFPDEKIHSGQSDFDPPKYKPAPDVYLKAAEAEGIPVSSCIAIEDSVSGIGSAANADIALIVGYVGGSHVAKELETNQAESLLMGSKSDNGRGADVVIRDMEDLPTVCNYFLDLKLDAPDRFERREYDFSSIVGLLRDRCWISEKHGGGGYAPATPEAPNPR